MGALLENDPRRLHVISFLCPEQIKKERATEPENECVYEEN